MNKTEQNKMIDYLEKNSVDGVKDYHILHVQDSYQISTKGIKEQFIKRYTLSPLNSDQTLSLTNLKVPFLDDCVLDGIDYCFKMNFERDVYLFGNKKKLYIYCETFGLNNDNLFQLKHKNKLKRIDNARIVDNTIVVFHNLGITFYETWFTEKGEITVFPKTISRIDMRYFKLANGSEVIIMNNGHRYYFITDIDEMIRAIENNDYIFDTSVLRDIKSSAFIKDYENFERFVKDLGSFGKSCTLKIVKGKDHPKLANDGELVISEYDFREYVAERLKEYFDRVDMNRTSAIKPLGVSYSTAYRVLKNSKDSPRIQTLKLILENLNKMGY